MARKRFDRQRLIDLAVDNTRGPREEPGAPVAPKCKRERCGREFTPVRDWQDYCSGVCRSADWRDRRGLGTKRRVR